MITVILPIYNICKEFLSACLDSLQRQTYQDFEVLMVDDGSEPGVHTCCMRYQEQDPRYRYLRQENAGVCAARNNGMDHAAGDYICFIDPDDWVSDTYLELLVREITATEADIAMVDGAVHYKAQSVENHFLATERTVLEGKEKNLLIYQLFSRKICAYYPPEIPAGTAWAKIFRTAFLREKELRFLPELRRVEDILFNMHAYQQADRIAYLPECLYHYRVSTDSVSHRFDPDVIPQFERFFAEAENFLDRYQKERLLYDALAMRELTAVHSYLRFYYFRIQNKPQKEIDQEIDTLLSREPYASALRQIDQRLLTKQEYLFVLALKHRSYLLLRALVKGRELLKR